MRIQTVTAAEFKWTASTSIPIPMLLDALASLVAAVLLASLVIRPWFIASNPPSNADNRIAASASENAGDVKIRPTPDGRETVVSAYGGAPFYYRSDVKLDRPDGTDLELKRLGWDGDSLYFPIDGGARVVRWSGTFGVMVDFLHNKAISRLGKGAHGRKIRDGVIETVETSGTLKGQPAPAQLRLTDLFERLEFTHGHNVLLLTGMARLASWTPTIRPYVGIGAGVALPHVEVGFAGETGNTRTNEYQYAGPAAQLIAGLELRHGRGSYFIEYKFTWASIAAALTGNRSWSLKNVESLKAVPRWLLEPFVGLMELPGDLSRQLYRWRNGETAAGHLSTRLSAHQLVGGAGYVWPGVTKAVK